MHTLGKRARCQSLREFESLILRSYKISPLWGDFVERRMGDSKDGADTEPAGEVASRGRKNF